MLRVITSEGEVFAFCSECVPGIQYVQTSFELWQPVAELRGTRGHEHGASRCVRCNGPLQGREGCRRDEHAA